VSGDVRSAPPELHEFESELMELMWERGECNVRAALEELNQRSDKERKYTTVMTTMARLDKKGLLVRRREGKTDIYKPAMSRAEYHEARAAAEVGALVANYGDAALVHFARQMDQLDPKRRDQLRRLARRDAS
jgi:predicted transcriptional regulator